MEEVPKGVSCIVYKLQQAECFPWFLSETSRKSTKKNRTLHPRIVPFSGQKQYSTGKARKLRANNITSDEQ